MFQFPRFPLPTLCVQVGVLTPLRVVGFPIRIPVDQSPFDGSPQLFAVNYVLHRFWAPRHPPLALCSLEIKMLVLAMKLSKIDCALVVADLRRRQLHPEQTAGPGRRCGRAQWLLLQNRTEDPDATSRLRRRPYSTYDWTIETSRQISGQQRVFISNEMTHDSLERR